MAGEYEDYNTTSKSYDTGRRPVGLEVFIGAIAQLMDGQLNKAKVVDIGCGTGNYAAALSPFVGQITGVEYNSGMLEQAKMKTANLSNVKIIQGDATNIPLPDSVCDVVTCTQVIHHLVPENFSGLCQFLTEAKRILKHKGVLIINSDSPEQASKCWIGAGLAPIAGKIVADRHPPFDVLFSKMSDAGFTVTEAVSHCFQTLHPPSVLTDPLGPLSEEWRRIDSSWSCVSDEELKQAQLEWKRRQKEGTTHEVFEERNKMIKQIGETTTIIAYTSLK